MFLNKIIMTILVTLSIVLLSGCQVPKTIPDAGPDKTVLVGEASSVTAINSIASGERIKFGWILVSKPVASNLTVTVIADALQEPKKNRYFSTDRSYNFVLDAAGEYVFALGVRSGEGYISLPDYVTVTATDNGVDPAPVNTAPVADAGADFSTTLNTQVILDGSQSYDDETSIQSYQWSFVSKPAGSKPGLSGESKVNVSFTPDVAGDYVVQLVVGDGTTYSAADTVIVTAKDPAPVNTAPVAIAGADQSGVTATTISVNGSQSYDAESAIAYQWSFINRPAGSNATFSGATQANASFTPDVAGTYVAQLTVTDGSLSASDTAMITIVDPAPVNTAPVAKAGNDFSIDINTPITLDGSQSYSAQSAITSYQWSFVSKPAGSKPGLSGESKANVSLKPDVAGDYVLQLVVGDGVKFSAPDQIVITATAVAAANTAPIAVISAPSIADVQVEAVLDGGFSNDADNDPINYDWKIIGKPAGSNTVLTAANQMVSAFTPDVAGSYTVSLIVNDGKTLSSPAQVVIQANDVTTTTSTTTTTTPPTTTTTTPVPTGGVITTFILESNSSSNQTNVPFTFGQILKAGDVFPGTALVGVTSNGSVIPLQVDEKATHNSDGSLRHVIISGVAPSLPANGSISVALQSTTSTAVNNIALSDLLATSFNGQLSMNVGGKAYQVDLRSMMNSQSPSQQWLKGNKASEWQYVYPLKDANGVKHPHLVARFYIRAYEGLQSVRVSVIVENNWTFVTAPQNFTYGVDMVLGGQTVYSNANVNHIHHSRWRKVFFWNQTPAVHVRHDVNYMISTKAIPNFDQTQIPTENTLTSIYSAWNNASTDIMGLGFLNAYMPATGGRPDIGPQTKWAAIYLLTQDVRAAEITLGTGELAGSWPIHYRDINTDRPMSIDDYPYVTLLGRYSDTLNPKTGQYEAFPACGGNCSSNMTPDSSHQPSLAYVPYMVTGDYFFLEELQFWANYNMIQYNPNYRGHEKGTVTSDQVRGQAWTLRTLGHAAYITPDNDVFRNYFEVKIANNIVKRESLIASNPRLGYIMPTVDGTLNTSRPWMDDFYTWSIGHLIELGFTQAQAILDWKATFPVGRMMDPGFCWMYASGYDFKLGNGTTAFTTLKEVFDNTYPGASNYACGSQAMADAYKAASYSVYSDLTVNANDMVGYPDSAIGFPSNMQPALAVSVDGGAVDAQAAWNKFDSRNTKPVYSSAPQFNIVPR